VTGLRIGIDARAAAEVPAGRGRYVRELLRALARRNDDHRYSLYTRRRWDEQLDGRFSWRERQLPEAVWHIWAASDASRACDVFLATNSYVTPWFLRIPTLLVVHDLIPFQPGIAVNRRAAAIERVTISRALRRAAAIVCDSEATRRDLVRLSPATEAKSSVVHLAAGPEFSRRRTPSELEDTRRRFELVDPFVLSVGTLEPRKNLLAVLDAFASLEPRLQARHRLLIVGPRGWEFEGILQRAERLGDRVLQVGHVSDEDLAALYELCEIFCYPSLYEGFGLPLLEAMIAGAPSITSNTSSLPEVGGDAVRYVDPRNTAEIADALAQLLDSEQERESLGQRARRQAARFSWERTANETIRQLTALARPGR
jgi:glycosyltransferase involved in cell wall biosynthesis